MTYHAITSSPLSQLLAEMADRTPYYYVTVVAPTYSPLPIVYGAFRNHRQAFRASAKAAVSFGSARVVRFFGASEWLECLE